MLYTIIGGRVDMSKIVMFVVVVLLFTSLFTVVFIVYQITLNHSFDHIWTKAYHLILITCAFSPQILVITINNHL